MVLKAVKEAGAIGRQASQVTLFKVNCAVKLWQALEKGPRAVRSMQDLRHAEPPMVYRYRPSASGSARPSTSLARPTPVFSPIMDTDLPDFGSSGARFERRALAPPRAPAVAPGVPRVEAATPARYQFPAVLPTVVLLPKDQGERYGLEKMATPGSLKQEIQVYKQWSAVPINTARGRAYIAGVQTTSLEKTSSVIRGFMGYAAKAFALPAGELRLELYADPRLMARFVAYLRARTVKQGHITKHIGVARKVNAYLAADAEEGSEVCLHARRMDDWLGILESQIYASMPAVVKTGLPSAVLMYQ